MKNIKDYTLDELKEQLKEIYILGINYGSLELACIASIMLKLEGIVCYGGNIMKKFRKVYIEATNCQKSNFNISLKKNRKYLLIDENIMTGETLKKAKEYCDRGIKIVKKMKERGEDVEKIEVLINKLLAMLDEEE